MTRRVKMNREKKAGPERTCGSIEDPSFMKELEGMFEKGDIDCARMMSRMKAMCCGAPEESEKQEHPEEGKKT